MKSRVRLAVLFIAALFVVGTAQARPSRPAYQGAKYVFLFIGDGMSLTQVHSAEAYIADQQYQENGKAVEPVEAGKLCMSQFPVLGMITTYDYGAFCTDSASAGTALATGRKTRSGMINMSPDKTESFTTIAELAKRQGKKVGILSSVSIDHATPASFYAKVPSRGNMYEIGMQMATSNFDYFAGGGLAKPIPADPNLSSVWKALADNGYTVVDTKAGFQALAPGAYQKVYAINPVLDGSKALPYEIDRKNDVDSNLSLADFTRKGIELLHDESNPYGFFMMVEGGKIDWTCHANDARTSIDDTIAFDDAVAEAVKFYNKYPKDTLIIVTADHETGGLTIGWAGTGYANRFDYLKGQTMSYQAFDEQLMAYKAGHVAAGTTPEDIDAEMKAMILTAFGMDIDQTPVSAAQRALLEDAFDLMMASQKGDYLLYGGYNPLSVTVTHILNNNSGIGWTSYAHTGTPVQVMALGRESWRFDGFYDNTDVADKMALVMRVKLNN